MQMRMLCCIHIRWVLDGGYEGMLCHVTWGGFVVGGYLCGLGGCPFLGYLDYRDSFLWCVEVRVSGCRELRYEISTENYEDTHFKAVLPWPTEMCSYIHQDSQKKTSKKGIATSAMQHERWQKVHHI